MPIENVAPGFSIDVADSAGPSGFLGKLHVIVAGRHARDSQPLVEIHGPVGVVPALVGAPFPGTRGREIDMRYRFARQVPEPGSLAVGPECQMGSTAQARAVRSLLTIDT